MAAEIDSEMLSLAGYQYSQKNYEDSCKSFSICVSQAPSPRGYLGLAQSQYKLKNYQSVIENANLALSMLQSDDQSKSNLWAHLKLLQSKSYVKLVELSMARDLLLEIIEKSQIPDHLKIAETRLKQIQANMNGNDEYQEFNRIYKVQQFTEGSLYHLISKTWYDL